jgi:hypothetical protein
MSRARESTHVWAVADDVAQAVEDLHRDWESRRSPTWAIDMDPTGWKRPLQPLSPKQQSERARCVALLAAKDHTAGKGHSRHTCPQPGSRHWRRPGRPAPCWRPETTSSGAPATYDDTETGRAVRDLEQARAGRRRAEQDAQHATRWRQRRAVTKEQIHRADLEADAQ